MDIANGFRLTALPQTSSVTVGFAVAISGLTNNPTHGLNAMRGVTLTAQVSMTGGKVAVPQGIAYQWRSAAGGPIPGATEASFTPDAGLPDLDALSCEVTVPGQRARSSAPVILREVPPAVQNSLYDEVFDLDTGTQLVASAAAFSGQGLSFAVSGAGASIDPVTGEISVPTDIEVEGAVVTVSATNSGGTVTAAFQITIENLVVVEGAIPFGALTPAGAGGVPVPGASITGGDLAGHWQISNGILSPSAAGQGALDGVYNLTFDTGDTLDVLIERDKATANPEEIAAVFDTLPVTARGLMVWDGDASSIVRQRLSPKVFLSEMVVEPANWVEDADPRRSIRPVRLGGLFIGGDPSGDAITRMENLTVQGFEFQMLADPAIGEYSSNDGIILVERPSRHIVIRQNDIWSRDLREIILADDFRENSDTHMMKRGITSSKYSGTNEHIRIEENYIHDVARGGSLVSLNAYGGQNSRFCNNVLENAYRTFVVFGYSSGLDIFDNTGLHITASLNDTSGSIAEAPHAGLIGFDAGGYQSCRDINFMGNMLHVGWSRKLIEQDLGITGFSSAALGVKLNDPNEAGAYYNVTIAFNLIVAHNQSIEVEGASADEHILIFNNTLASEDYTSSVGGPIISFKGAENVRLWNNISTGYFFSSKEGNEFFVRTLDTLEGYGNLKINGTRGHAGTIDYFRGDPTKGFDLLTIEECYEAFVPKPTTAAMLSAQKKGALGHGLYLGNGVHTATYSPPTLTAGTDAARTEWATNGNYRQFGDVTRRDGMNPNNTTIVMEFEGRTAPADDGVDSYIVGAKNNRWALAKDIADRLCLRLANGDGENVLEICSSQRLPSSRGKYHGVISVNIATGRFQIMIDGVLDPWVAHREWGDSKFSWYSNQTGFASDYVKGRVWDGTVALLLIDDADIDLETDAGANLFRTTTGPRAHAARGTDVNAADTLLFMEGTPSGIKQTGAFPGNWTPNGMTVFQ